MNKTKIVSAIDIGSSKITTLIAQVSIDAITFEETVNIIGAASVASKGVKKGQIVNIEETVEATISAVEAAERMAGYNLTSAFVTVGGGHISSSNSTGVVAVSDPEGEIGYEDVNRVMEAARAISLPSSREIIHVLARGFVVDGEGGVKDPIGMTGVRLEVETHIITASSPALKNLGKTLHEVGIAIEEVVFSGLASSYSVISETEKELGCVLIDIGGGTTSIAAYIDGSLSYSATLPIGAKNVTNDLAIGLRVSLDVADKIKLDLSKKVKEGAKSDVVEVTDPDTKEIKKVSRRTLTDGIIKPRLNEVFTMIRMDLEKNNIINRVPSGAVITGGGAATFGVSDAAKRMLSLPVRIGTPFGVAGLVDEILSPQYAAPVGLVLYGAKKAALGQGNNGGGGIGKKIKLPTGGIIGRLIEGIRDLLP